LKQGKLVLRDAAKALTLGRRIVAVVGVVGVGFDVAFGLGAMNTIE
jgi:hypothetical protein